MSLELILGPMFSGKSSELIRRINRYMVVYGKESVLCIKYSGDNRYSESGIATHDRIEKNALCVDKLSETLVSGVIKIIAIDEGQFFPEIIEFTKLMILKGKKVIISGLDGDFQMKPFKYNLLELIPICDSVVKLTAICHSCKKDAPFTKRTTNDTEQTVIGGENMYHAACRACSHK